MEWKVGRFFSWLLCFWEMPMTGTVCQGFYFFVDGICGQIPILKNFWRKTCSLSAAFLVDKNSQNFSSFPMGFEWISWLKLGSRLVEIRVSQKGPKKEIQFFCAIKSLSLFVFSYLSLEKGQGSAIVNLRSTPPQDASGKWRFIKIPYKKWTVTGWDPNHFAED